ncbi:hypothetical protein NFJ02_19g33030 [Pycnococcus provasolii]
MLQINFPTTEEKAFMRNYEQNWRRMAGVVREAAGWRDGVVGLFGLGVAPKYVENVLELAARTREKLLVEQCISCEEVERDLARRRRKTGRHNPPPNATPWAPGVLRTATRGSAR